MAQQRRKSAPPPGPGHDDATLEALDALADRLGVRGLEVAVIVEQVPGPVAGPPDTGSVLRPGDEANAH